MGKLSNSRGETLTETLVAILIAVLASMMLLTAAIAASNLNRAAAAADADLRAQQEVVERQDEVNGIAYVTIEDGNKTTRYPVQRYGGGTRGLQAYAVEEETP